MLTRNPFILLFTLAVVQTGMLGYLMLSYQQPKGGQEKLQAVSSIPDHYADDFMIASSPPNIDQALLRQIIREEIQQAFANAPNGALADHTDEPVQNTPAVDPYLYDEVAMEIEQLKGAGPVSDIQMLMLEKKIMSLDQNGQDAMLSELVKSINSGEIAARFN